MKIILLVILFNSVSCDWVSLFKEAVKDVGKNPTPCQIAMLRIFDECINTVSKDGTIKGKYCSKTGMAQSILIQNVPNNTSSLDQLRLVQAVQPIFQQQTTGIGFPIAVCLPHQCSTEEINKMIKIFEWSAFECPSELSCVNGIRALSMVWVVYGHSLCAYALSPVINLVDLLAYINTLKAMVVHAGVFAVDTFFCLSGLLLTYIFIKSVNKMDKFNLLSFYLHRYLRLTPALLILIFSTVTIFEYLGSGPRWATGVQYYKNPCTENWWGLCCISRTMSMIVVLSLWGAVIAIMLGLVFAGHDTLMGSEYKAFDNIMYLTFVRPVWALCICWIVLACTCEYGGIINSFLSHPAWQVLGRFSYSIYLVHFNIIMWRTFSLKNGIYFNDINLQYEFWGHFAFSTMLAVFWVLAFESPIIVLEKYIFGR
nr:unnamed protein product [Callosobruchus analis]